MKKILCFLFQYAFYLFNLVHFLGLIVGKKRVKEIFLHFVSSKEKALRFLKPLSVRLTAVSYCFALVL